MSARAIAMTILVAEDDPDDRALARDAFAEARVPNRIDFVEDGEELLAYLRNEGRYADSGAYPSPGLILLDLTMPRLGGRAVVSFAVGLATGASLFQSRDFSAISRTMAR